MTDISPPGPSVPTRFDLTAPVEHGDVFLDLVPHPEVLQHGTVRASVLSFVIDAVAAIGEDDDESVWMFTSDLSVRMRAVPAPGRIRAASTLRRRGRRSLVATVDLTAEDGAPVAAGAIGFATVPRREGDPPKVVYTVERAGQLFQGGGRMSRPLREEAGIEVVDPAEGVVQVAVTPAVQNPAGTLQGAMVALLAEAAAEDLVATRFESPVVVTDLDLRYLVPARVGPVRTRSRLLGTGPGAPVEVELVDTSTDTVTTLAYARAVPAP